ncbi:MAG TPA: cupin domain-containing protein [Baekduia sp.]|nr:cupin domain-containing protein [Baekduia sp.]
MHRAEAHRATQADETREFLNGKGKVELCHLSSGDAGLGTFEPGWRWSEHVKPLSGTETCQVEHIGYVLQGRMGLHFDDGTDLEVSAGDFFVMPPGHDAWVVGDEACKVVDFGGLSGYATGH